MLNSTYLLIIYGLIIVLMYYISEYKMQKRIIRKQEEDIDNLLYKLSKKSPLKFSKSPDMYPKNQVDSIPPKKNKP